MDTSGFDLIEVTALKSRENYRISNEHCSAYQEKQKSTLRFNIATD
ncbi:hypothetical protein [Priestia flexa]|nr:hypothetical protein [Priestia flexa]MBY6088646.1 hypothetical protein [Priestia flexa]